MTQAIRSRFTHAVAYIPECRPDIISPAWLDWLQELGYTGIYLENDPFQPKRSGNASQFSTLYRLISLYDLAWGEHRHRLRDWISLACDLAHQRGLKVYLALWEPRIPAEAWGLFPLEWRGRGGWDRPQWNHISWCMSVPAAQQAFEEMATEAFRQVRAIDGLKMGTHDNDACLCNDTCPHCQGTPRAVLTRRVFTSLLRATERAALHRPELEYVIYPWWWLPEEREAIVEVMADRNTLLMSRSTWGLIQTWNNRELGRNMDIALGLPGVSDEFRGEVAFARQHDWPVVDMTAFAHSLEYLWLPYTPAPNRVAERLCDLQNAGAAGWFDYDCGGVYPGINTEIIREFQRHGASDARELVTTTLMQLYPEGEQTAAAQAYLLVEKALSCRPVAFNPPDVINFSGRFVIEACIGLPFDPGMISGQDQGHRTFFTAPGNFLTPGSLPLLMEMYSACADAWGAAEAALMPLQGQGEWAVSILPWEKQVVRAHALATRSALRFIQMADNRLARGQGMLDAATERVRLIPLFESEIQDTAEFRQLWLGDRRLLGNSNIRLMEFLKNCVPWIYVNPDDPFASKLKWMQEYLTQLHACMQWDCVPVWKLQK